MALKLNNNNLEVKLYQSYLFRLHWFNICHDQTLLHEYFALYFIYFLYFETFIYF